MLLEFWCLVIPGMKRTLPHAAPKSMAVYQVGSSKDEEGPEVFDPLQAESLDFKTLKRSFDF